MTHCRQGKLEFQGTSGRRVEGRFDGAKLSTDGGMLLVREVAEGNRFFNRLSRCFTDQRLQEAVVHSVEALVKQRVYGLIAGYEDVSGHDTIRSCNSCQEWCQVSPSLRATARLVGLSCRPRRYRKPSGTRR